MADHEAVSRWEAIEGLRQYTSHVHPLGDLIEHDIDSEGDCVCGPRVEPVPTDDAGGLGWMYVHSSLDGREKEEAGRG
jgi:hypothetical protein